jgi:hypothetical protein
MCVRSKRAEVAELVDAVDSKSTARQGLRVRVSPSVPYGLFASAGNASF